MQPLPVSLAERFQHITSRAAWRYHVFILPEELLARSYSIVGDDARLRHFVRKLVLGEGLACLGGRRARAGGGKMHACMGKILAL